MFSQFISYMFDHWLFWGVFFSIVGVFSLVGVIFGLFSSIGDRTRYRDATATFPAGSPEFLEAISRLSNSPVGAGGEFRILNNGGEFFPALLSALNGAQKSITFTTYIWEPGKVSDLVFEALISRANKGVAVKLLLDGFGCILVPQDKVDELKKAGGLVSHFRSPRLGKIMRLHRRNHRRAIVIDGKTGFTGGMSVADKWLGNARNPEEWRDTMFELKGAPALSLQAAFAELWAGTRGEIIAGPEFYPLLSENKNPQLKFVSIASSPAEDTQPLPKFFWFSMASAKKSIHITSSYVVPDRHLRGILMSRAKAGIDVSLLIPSKHSDAKPIQWASHYYFEDFLKAGIKIYEYTPTMIHSKIMVVDGEWSVIGSANMDMRSVELNVENEFGVQDKKLAEDLEKYFEADLSKSKPITLEKWLKRGLWEKILEAVFVKFKKQY